MEKHTALEYSYIAEWSEEDQEYVGLCEEFPGLSWLDITVAKTIEGIKNVVAEVLDDMYSDAEEPPQPLNQLNINEC